MNGNLGWSSNSSPSDSAVVAFTQLHQGAGWNPAVPYNAITGLFLLANSI